MFVATRALDVERVRLLGGYRRLETRIEANGAALTGLDAVGFGRVRVRR